MNRVFNSVLFVFFICFNLLGVPSYPNLIKLEDGSQIYIKGDETHKWGVTENGYTILPFGEGWVYAKKSSKGFAEPSQYMLKRNADTDTKIFLETQSKNIPIEPCNNNNESTGWKSRKKELNQIVGERKGLVVLMSFPDLQFEKSKEDIERLFNQVGYSEEGAMGSVADYFLWASSNQLNFTCDVIGPFISSHEMKYYGKNVGPEGRDQNTFKLFEEALEHAKQTIDLSDYDSNGDGYIDNLHIIFAGFGEEAGAKSDAIWSHEMTFPEIEVGGIKIDRYSCAPELRGNSGHGISRIGPHCHEMGHALGAMDYYDVDYSNNGQYSGTGLWDIMSSGSWNNEGISPPGFNPYVKNYNFGWSEPQTLEEGYNEILPICDDHTQIFQLETSRDGDFYLLENRRKVDFDAFIPGEGLLIFHIGPEIELLSKTNNINSSFPQQCYVVCASSSYIYPTSDSQSYGDIDSSSCPFPGTSDNRNFSDCSVPASLCFDGSESGIVLNDISFMPESNTICLFNGTPPAPEYVWTEDFETSQWENEWFQDGDSWKIASVKSHENLNNEVAINNKAPVYHKTNYLYSRLSTSLNGKENIRTIQTKNICLEEPTEYILNLEYYNSPLVGSSFDYDNKLNIYIEAKGEEPHLISSLIGTDNEWINKSFIIPKMSNYKDISFVLESRGYSAGYVCIDNIRLQKNNRNDVIEINAPNKNNISISVFDNSVVIHSQINSRVHIYDASGRLIVDKRIGIGNTAFYIPKGIYFINSVDPTISPIKIIVK